MLNLIRMNVYRMLRTKSMLVIFLLMLLMSGFSAYLTVNVDKIMEDQIQQEAKENESIPSDLGISVEAPSVEDGDVPDFLTYFCNEISSGLLLIFFTIAASLFVHAEDKSGFIKNIAGQTRYKFHIYLAKIVPLCLYLIVCMIGYGLVQFCILKYYFGSDLAFGTMQLKTAVYMIGIQLFLHLVFMNGLAMLVTICKSTAVSITAGILSAGGFGSIFTNAVNHVFHINIDPWLVCHNIKLLGTQTQASDLLHALGVGILFFTFYNLIGTVWFAKKDVV